MDVRVKFGDSIVKQWPNYSTLLPAGPDLLTFLQYLIAFCSRLEEPVMSYPAGF